MPHHPVLALPVIDTQRCTGCGWCVAACPLDLLSLERQGWKKHAILEHAERCTGCSYCALRCPFQVVQMQKKDASTDTLK